MLAEIAAGLSSLKAAKDIVQGLDALKTGAAINEVKINLQGLILEAQQALFAAQEAQTAAADQIRQLKHTISDFERWSAEAERYELADAGQGTVAYRPKEGMENGEPAHWLCAPCFQNQKKSFLQFELRFPGRNEYLCCPTCGAEMITSGDRNTAYDKPRRR